MVMLFVGWLIYRIIKIKCYIYRKVDLTRDMGEEVYQKGAPRKIIHPRLHLVQKKNKWEISHARWEISCRGREKWIDLKTVVAIIILFYLQPSNFRDPT